MGDITLEIAKQIKINRERIGLSKKELAAAVGAAPSTVSGWENGAYAPGANTIVRLSELFGITIDAIYGIDDKELAAISDNELDADVLGLIKGMSPEKLAQAKNFLHFLSEQAGRKE